MKLVSAKQKTAPLDPSERINLCNEIENIQVSEDTTFRLSDFNSDIIFFDVGSIYGNVTIGVFCNRPYRKYTLIARNRSTKFNVIFDFRGDRGASIDKYSNETDPVFKTGSSGIIDLYQISNTIIHLVQHTLSLI